MPAHGCRQQLICLLSLPARCRLLCWCHPLLLTTISVACLLVCLLTDHTRQGFEGLLTYLKAEVVQWPHHRLRRVLSAALASPISPQDLADAEAALQQGFTGSLSRAPTFSAEADAAGAGSTGEEEGVECAAAGSAALSPAQASRTASLASQPSMTAAGAGEAGAAGAGGEDAVTADLAAAQQQIDDEVRSGYILCIVCMQPCFFGVRSVGVHICMHFMLNMCAA